MKFNQDFKTLLLIKMIACLTLQMLLISQATDQDSVKKKKTENKKQKGSACPKLSAKTAQQMQIKALDLPLPKPVHS